MLSRLNGRVRARNIEEVRVAPRPLDLLTPFISEERQHHIAAAAEAARRMLDGRAVININSTARGGGVAELVQALCGYARGAGVDSRWLVIEGDEEFFRITKRAHNNLHGEPGDGGPLREAERALYERVLAENAASLAPRIRPGDIVILHDPQTAGLAPAMLAGGARVIWRSHVGSERHDEVVRAGWDFLRPYIQMADVSIFSLAEYAPEWLEPAAVRVINPSIDPASAKSQDISGADARQILRQVGLLDGPPPPRPPLFRREDGSPSPVTRRVELVSEGDLPRAADPVVAQIARWDALKDMAETAEAARRADEDGAGSDRASSRPPQDEDS